MHTQVSGPEMIMKCVSDALLEIMAYLLAGPLEVIKGLFRTLKDIAREGFDKLTKFVKGFAATLRTTLIEQVEKLREYLNKMACRVVESLGIQKAVDRLVLIFGEGCTDGLTVTYILNTISSTMEALSHSTGSDTKELMIAMIEIIDPFLQMFKKVTVYVRQVEQSVADLTNMNWLADAILSTFMPVIDRLENGTLTAMEGAEDGAENVIQRLLDYVLTQAESLVEGVAAAGSKLAGELFLEIIPSWLPALLEKVRGMHTYRHAYL